MEISEKEFAVIKEISNNHLPDQRTIATRTGISLGLTNLIIKRLIKMGYVKSKQLTSKKIQYILTPEGFKEKAKKSYNFTLKTINVVKKMREAIQELIITKNKSGIVDFEIHGDSELADIAEIAMNNLSGSGIKYTRKRNGDTTSTASVLLCHSKDQENREEIDILKYLTEIASLRSQ